MESPGDKQWKDAMDYELAKLEEMNTWSETDELDVPPEAQSFPGWGSPHKDLESKERKVQVPLGSCKR